MKSLFLSSLLALGLLAVPAQAAEYPAKPITLMTAFNAGGGSDVSHRLLEKFAKGVFDQPIVVTYKAGAGGEIGWTWLVGAKADGYTIGGVDLPHIVLQPMLRPKGSRATKRNSSARFAASFTTPTWSWFPKTALIRRLRISLSTPRPIPAR